jgi:hypothetical protein
MIPSFLLISQFFLSYTLIEVWVKDLPQEKAGDNFSPTTRWRDNDLIPAQASSIVFSCHNALK